MQNETTKPEATNNVASPAQPHLLCCPFCGSDNLVDGIWWLDEQGEIDAVECATCYAGAPVNSWNNRA